MAAGAMMPTMMAPSQNITALEPASRLPTTAARSTMGTSGSVGSK